MLDGNDYVEKCLRSATINDPAKLVFGIPTSKWEASVCDKESFSRFICEDVVARNTLRLLQFSIKPGRKAENHSIWIKVSAENFK